MARIDVLKQALQVIKDYVATEDPSFWPWFTEHISFMIEFEQRKMKGEAPLQSMDDKERLIDSAGIIDGGIGPFGGAAMHDMPNCDAKKYMTEVQYIAREMKKEYLDK